MISTSFSLFLVFCCIPFLAEGSILAPNSYLPWELGTCLTPGVKQNFHVEKFFTGTWYEQRSYGNYLFQADGSCTTMKSNISDGIISVLNYHYEPLLHKFISVRGKSSTTSIIANLARIPVTYKFLDGLVSFDVPYDIVDTDYENWALIYTCKQHLLFKIEMSWVLTRERGDSTFDSVIKDAVSSAGIDYKTFIPQKNVDCPDEPDL